MSDPGAVVLRVARLDAVVATLPADENWLSPSEAARLPRLRAPRRRQQYLAGHWLLRQLLADRLGGQPADWPLRQIEDRPPQLDVEHAAAPFLSISHSGEWIACAVAADPIGIDLEQRPRRHALASVAHLLCAAGETPADLDDDALLRRWVAKEAYIKRDGGAALPQRLAELQLLPTQPAAAAIRLWSGAYFHLAIASTAPCDLRIDCGPDEVEAGECWRVEERAGR